MPEENQDIDTTTAVSTESSLLLEEMARAGVLYGRKKSKTHPRMKKFIFATRNGFEVFDLPKTSSALEKAKSFLTEIVSGRGMVLLVGTSPAAKELIRGIAEKTSFPFVTERWLGGTLTNYKTLSKRIDHYKQLKADKAAGKLDKYTKKERVMIDKKIEKMTRLFGGLENLNRLPDAVFIIDAMKHDIAVREAQKRNIPVVAMINSDTDPESVDHIIPANTNSKTSLEWVVDRLSDAFTAPPKSSIPPPDSAADKEKSISGEPEKKENRKE